MESGEHFKHIVYLFFLLCSGPIESNLLLKVKQPSIYHKLFAPDSLIELLVVDIHQLEFHILFFLSVFVCKLHLSQ